MVSIELFEVVRNIEFGAIFSPHTGW